MGEPVDGKFDFTVVFRKQPQTQCLRFQNHGTGYFLIINNLNNVSGFHKVLNSCGGVLDGSPS